MYIRCHLLASFSLHRNPYLLLIFLCLSFFDDNLIKFRSNAYSLKTISCSNLDTKRLFFSAVYSQAFNERRMKKKIKSQFVCNEMRSHHAAKIEGRRSKNKQIEREIKRASGLVDLNLEFQFPYSRLVFLVRWRSIYSSGSFHWSDDNMSLRKRILNVS